MQTTVGCGSSRWIRRAWTFARPRCTRPRWRSLATDAGDHARVLAVLGSKLDEVPLHRSSRILAGVLRANALEKSGDVVAAAADLERTMRTRQSALASVKLLVARAPSRWQTCEKSLGIANRAVRADLVPHLPAGPRARLAWLGLPGLAGVVVGIQSSTVAALAGGTSAILLGVWGITSDQRRRARIAQESERVSGRILGAREVDDMYVELDVFIERPAGDVKVSTRQIWGASLRKLPLESYVGCTFTGFWHPAHPTVLPRITIQQSVNKTSA